MRGLFIALREAPLALTDSEAPEPLNILRCVVAPPALIAARTRQSPEPLAESEPTRAYAELVGCLPYLVCALPLKHAQSLNLADTFL
jgi:hypothetical protein